MSETITLQASSTYFVPTAAYARVSAYPVFQKITWDIISIGGWGWGAGSAGGIAVGSGVVLKPVGVYFATYRVYDLAAMGGGVINPGPILGPPMDGAGGAGAGDTGGNAGAGGGGGDAGASSTGGDPGTGGAGGDAGASGTGGDPGTGGAGGDGGGS
ncbi:hypothetical protein WMF04_08775 [Sorangium sp. So ce260]|uniref:hypothetical protein n=1 Tax=Sorangium sp. So ce260 TaxID=3133291 RepID=UPI003F60475D